MKRTTCLLLLTALLLLVNAEGGSPSAAQRRRGRPDRAQEGSSITVKTKHPNRKNPQDYYSCPNCDLRGVDLSGKYMESANLSGADLTGAKLRGTNLDGASLVGTILDGADLEGAVLNPSVKGVADLARASLRGASLKGAQMLGADLQFAHMEGADFTGANLSRAAFGPRIRAGVFNGRKTTFRRARLRRDFKTDEASMDIADVQWEPSPGAGAGEALVCGWADLSGLTSRIYVSPGGSDSETCGTSNEQSCKTIAKGIERCSGQGCGVLVEWAEYNIAATLRLRDGVNLYGGCLPASAARPELFSVIYAAPGGQPVVSADAINTNATILQGFQLSGSASGGTNGESSVALLVTNSSKLSVLNSEIVANTGSKGADGQGNSSGMSGNNASKRTRGANSFCSNTDGGDGAGEYAVYVINYAFSFQCVGSCPNGCTGSTGLSGSTGYFARGGRGPGNPNCHECPASKGLTGGAGEGGRNAGCGVKGNVSTDTAGSFRGNAWTGSVSGSGTRGGDGGGGGGGGSGGYKAGSCFYVKTEFYGNSGGGGGAGGCGALGGGGGRQGGASFAAVLVNSTVTIKDSRLIGGLSGAGGMGGSASSGGKGGKGADGDTNQGGGYGGKGGEGGVGGAGAGGAGGNGGPAVCVALVGNSALPGAPAHYYVGASGATGAPGRGGLAGVCNGPDGDQGSQGLVAEAHQFSAGARPRTR
ncbi:MAG TPA: pentapeptide repeat-containing protein [Pyrinomonadaceae bacterium]